MKTLNRYILKELVQTFVFALIAMTALLIIIGLVREAVSKSIPLTHIVRLIPFVLVDMARISIPMTLLLAVTTFFAKMSGNNEVIALKSLGIPPWKILWPVMVFGVLVSLGTVWMNEVAVTWGRNGMATIVYGAAEDIILNQLRTTHHFVTPSGDLIIMVKGVDNRRLLSPKISCKSPPMNIEAQSAQLQIDFPRQELTVELNGVKVDAEGSGIYLSENRLFTFPLNKIVSKADDQSKRPADMGLGEIPAEIAQCNADIAVHRRTIAAHRAFAGTLGAIDQWQTSNIGSLQKRIQHEQRKIDRLNVEPPRRWSSGFSCLFFIWLGAPLAIWMRKADVFSSFFACFAPILLLYYPLLMYGMQGAKNGTLPPMAVWTANICLAVVGIGFLRRIHRF